MSEIKQKIYYLRGVAEGLGVKDDTNEGKLLNAILSVLDQIADELGDLSQRQNELDEYISAIDDDLAEVEDKVFGESDEFDEMEEDDTSYIEIKCPNCHELVYIDTDVFEDEDEDIICPNCHQYIYKYEGNEDSDNDEGE